MGKIKVGQHVRYQSDKYYDEWTYGIVEAVDGDDITVKVWYVPTLEVDLRDHTVLELEDIDLIEVLSPEDVKAYAEKLIAKHQASIDILKEVLL